VTSTSEFLVIGGGIFGITAALELRARGFDVSLLSPEPIPHPKAASTDISKAVRMEYGSDLDYMRMVDESIDGWQAWNEQFGVTLYHQVGMTFMNWTPTVRCCNPDTIRRDLTLLRSLVDFPPGILLAMSMVSTTNGRDMRRPGRSWLRWHLMPREMA
jgi:glycine/D-amino acid oxidase-like deaminating enzyme